MNIFTKWNKSSLIKDFKKAAEILSEYSDGYSSEHLSAEEFHQDLVDRITKLENGDDSVLEDLWIWFAPTCQWDDFVGDVDLGERIYQKIIKLKKSQQVTSAWQNAGLSAKLNFSPFYPPKAVCFCFFIKFTKRLTALATSRSELNFRSIQAHTSPSRGPLGAILSKKTIMFIKKLKLKNFKKYTDLEISFKENINVIIGENESGKSTILQAIDLVISGSRNKIENIGLEYLFNKNTIQGFFQNKQIQNLPHLEIELYFGNFTDPDFWGENNSDRNSDFGILLKCEPRDELSREISEILAQETNNFPFEFYNISFYKFSGSPYLGFTRKFKHILIDHSSINNEFATNSYIKTLYSSSIEPIEKSIHSNKYRQLKTDFKNTVLNNLNDQIPGKTYEFTLKSHSKSGLENDLTISEDNIDLLHRGKGRQCFIKTEYALSKNENELDFILLEEPENHLSHLNVHNLIERINLSRNKQIFIATHSNLISSRLDLRNSIFITSNNEFNIKLSDLSPETAKFFIKAPNKNLLEFILSKKVILVEGDAEYILIEKLFEEKYGTKPSNFGIHIIAIGGLSFKRYMEISNLLNIKTAIIRDNDKSFEKNIVENYSEYLSDFTQVFASTDDNEYTFEIAIYNYNRDLCEALISPQLRTRTVIEFMLAEKTESAFILLNSEENIQIPEYINNAYEWIVND